MKLAVIIPARNEPYLTRTIQEVLEKATGEVEVIAVLDGWKTDSVDDPRVRYLSIPESEGNHMREGINLAVKSTDAPYLMKLDAHCLLAKGFDEQLIADHHPDWVQIPRRYRLDAENWKIIEDGRPPIDYEYIIFQNLVTPIENASRGFLWGTAWDERTKEREHYPIDDTMHFQGSCWFMKREWFLQNNFLNPVYGGFAQESEEILFGTLKSGGQVKVNKNTYYAHLHKGLKQRAWFNLQAEEMKRSTVYSYNLWVRDNRELFSELVERFTPIPGWPSSWEKILWT